MKLTVLKAKLASDRDISLSPRTRRVIFSNSAFNFHEDQVLNEMSGTRIPRPDVQRVEGLTLAIESRGAWHTTQTTLAAKSTTASSAENKTRCSTSSHVSKRNLTLRESH